MFPIKKYGQISLKLYFIHDLVKQVAKLLIIQVCTYNIQYYNNITIIMYQRVVLCTNTTPVLYYTNLCSY